MTGDVARARRSVRTWWGPTLAALVGIASPVELAAMPLPALETQLQADPDPAVNPTGAASAFRRECADRSPSCRRR